MKKSAYQLKFLVLALSFSALSLLFTGCPWEEFNSINIEGIDLSQTPNGQYEGSYETTLVKATVSVTVDSNKITAISILRHENGRGKKAESILSRVIEAQSTRVDVVSGATASSRVILKSIENAVSK